jgi:hypothetical protein
MSLKPILNDPNALNNKSLNLFSNKVVSNELDTSAMSVGILSASVVDTTTLNSVDIVNSNSIQTNDITATNKITGSVVEGEAVIPKRKVQVLDPLVVLTIFNPNVNTENEYIITQLNATYDPTLGATCPGIILTDEQASSGDSYEMTITGMSAGVILQDAVAVAPPIRPFNFGGLPFAISPTQNQTLSVRLLWRPELQAWVRVG